MGVWMIIEHAYVEVIQMSTAATLNVSMECISIVITAILFICHWADNERNSRMNRLFMGILVVNFCILCSSITSWIFDGNPAPYARVFAVCANFSLYFFWYMLKIAISGYLFVYIPLKRLETRKYLLLISVCCAPFVVLLIISQFNGMIYWINDQNQFNRGPVYWIAYLPILLYGLDVFVILRHRKALLKTDLLTLLYMELLPFPVAFAQVFISGVLPLNTALTISLLILYTRVQLEQSRRLKEREQELQEARIDIMLSQIQPHFLYNTLTAIKNLISKNPEEAEILVTEFSAYLRQNMDALRQKELIPFARELEHLEIYLSIEKTRFKERLNIIYDLEIRDFLLPILTVQPLVENAIRHGVTKKREGGNVTVATRLVAEGVKITISDDGAGFDPSAPNPDRRRHIGLENVRQRLAAKCGGSLTLTSSPGGGTTAVILIPDKGSAQA